MSWGGIFDADKKETRIKELEVLMSAPDFWRDQVSANKIIQELKFLKSTTQLYRTQNEILNDLDELVVIVEPNDEHSISQIERDLASFEKQLAQMEFNQMLSDPDDRSGVILSINAGAGGTESCDWASMLLRMYTRWSERKGYKVKTVDFLAGEQAGVKNITLMIDGEYAYGYLKAEEGVHRLVRISPFDSNKRRHTSFASVDVVAEVADDIKIDVQEKDLRIDVFRAGGHGGQGVNTTDSAVRVTHIPTGLVVQCQNERSQLKNKATAMKVLYARLHQAERDKQRAQVKAAYSAKSDIAWGSQIRSYVLHPYSMVKDHRTGFETSNVQAVMDGELDALIQAWLKWNIGR
ncbi:MAG: peptide chain release factor 2 [Candidatus Omnitrophica bacterium CG1_02_43_210]|nr:MAG: peptide chain release factor 2 [Candidatus Omnitrophica bacterium CG1_02_43_210]